MSLMNLPSAWRGIKAMRRPFPDSKPRWAVWRIGGGRRFWFHIWTPTWHEGRGPYLSVGCGLFAFGRGY